MLRAYDGESDLGEIWWTDVGELLDLILDLSIAMHGLVRTRTLHGSVARSGCACAHGSIATGLKPSKINK